MKHKLSSLLALILIALQAYAQQAPVWKAEKLGPIEWMRVTELGYVVVSTLGSLKCLDPDNGMLLWENKNLGTVREDMFSEVSGTQYLQIGYGADEAARDMPMVALVDVVTGQLVFDSRKERLGVLGAYPLPRNQKLMVVGVEPGKFFAKLYMYDMGSGAKLWENAELFKGNATGKGLLAKMSNAVEGMVNMQSLTSSPVEADNQHVYITHPSYVIKLKAEDGAIVWRAKIEESTRAQLVYTRNKPDFIYVAAETESTAMTSTGNQPPGKVYASQYYAFNMNTGQAVWSGPVKVSNERINMVLPGTQGLVLLPGASGTNRPSANQLNYETGEGLWGKKGKGSKIDGTVIDYIFTTHGLLIATERESNNPNKDDKFNLNILNLETGELRYDKSIKMAGRLVRIEQVPKGILYQTTSEVNILDINTGGTVLTSSIESGAPKRIDRTLPFPSAINGDKLYAFATKDGIVMELDKTTGIVKSLNPAKLEFGGKELPKSIDAFENGLVLCSDQNVIMIGYDGLLKFNRYFNPPKESGLMRALALAEAAKGAILGVAMLAQSASFADVAMSSPDQSVQTLAGAGSVFMGGIAATSFAYTGKALADFNRRFKATTATDDYLIVLSEVAPRDFRLLQVDKHTGEVKTTLDLGKDRSPLYQVDLVLNQVYYLSSNYEITCFKL